MWAQGGGGKLPLKPQRLSWLGAGARLFFLEPLKSAWRKHLIWIPEKAQALFEGVCVGVGGGSLLSQSKSLIEIKKN